MQLRSPFRHLRETEDRLDRVAYLVTTEVEPNRRKKERAGTK